MFDGRDGEARQRAASVWQDARAKGYEATYWRQDENGRWHKQDLQR
jgi:DNA polymerase-3 subunit chi